MATGALVVTSIASGGFALAGAALSNWLSARRDQRQQAAQTALGLADSQSLVWNHEGNWPELNIEMEKQAARLTFAGVPGGLIDAIERVTVACWIEYQEVKGVDDDGRDVRGVRNELLDARRALNRAAVSWMLGKRGKESRSLVRQSIARADEAVAASERDR